MYAEQISMYIYVRMLSIKIAEMLRRLVKSGRLSPYVFLARNGGDMIINLRNALYSAFDKDQLGMRLYHE
jgi:hypothetical protein